jgi:hypothetical protein
MRGGLLNPFFQNGVDLYGNGYSSSQVVTYDADYQAVLDSATALGAVKPSDAQKAKQNQLVVDLKAANIWNSLDVLMVFATDGDSAFAAIDWKNPVTRQATLINSPTHTANLGFTGNGTSSYVDPNYNPSTQGVAYTVNDAGFFGYSGLALGGGTGMFIGASDGTNFSADLNLRSAANLMQYRINGSSAQQPANTNTIGFFHVKRTSATAVACFVNGASFNSSGSNNAGTLPNREIYLLARNGNSGAMNYYTGRIACFGAGASLNGQEAALNTAWNTYFTSL